ncbi:sulfurtransferase complex subunit TusB [Azomonas macrocytogenes]|uniref:tRNA 2-thiouridine synthesizing protein B n=1 Tax=Azomonas macrocytogenes TaxID=69962 RepID=A0A839SZL2_AZOMA|nr:sulfurtransferase complex subunit TusB [Azomonas macrocytogenes]MBB3101644.1 tRNA 2-thiouridine synthesizing protein B [Azomonas macrocytogenes]
MATLHLVSHSPFTDSRLASCLRLLDSDDALLLMGDAVYALCNGTSFREELESLAASISVFALTEDLQARDLTQTLPIRVKSIGYPEFVKLSCHYLRINSWL